ncbi:PPOX class F420-dependent oxidoreductase [Amycolatopsis albispora]|uniref:PPOX class F420-dependent enzyme n=1 Tax=Amycolatopsis albispora TaxID=1804986 RepID=A0A344LKJ8_9PSEU|nr:PPOX class F420-dependent oxidoreductase [Amycolatopsis albispora]AXB48572.1 PPOX class F420-dependent enzyme [Amycolatopsis albispora]
MASELDRLAAEKYVVVTTFRKNGTPVPTPVWIARRGDELVLWSDAQAGKVKRLRNDARVAVQASDFGGKKTHGDKVSGQARLLDGDETERVRSTIARKYGIVGQVTMFFSRLRGRQRTIGIAVTLDE